MTSNTELILENKEYKISKCLTYFYCILHFILGLDLGYFKGTTSTITKILLYTYSFVHSICVCANVFIYVFMESVDSFVTFWITSLLVQHTFNTVFLTFSDKTSSFCNLQNSLRSLDSKLAMGNKINMDCKLIVSCLLSVAYRSIITYFFCTRYNDECVNSVVGASISHFQLLANDSLLIVCFFIFYTVYLRLKTFVNYVQNNDSRVLDNLQIYKSIVEMVEKIKKLFDVLYAVALIIATPNLIITSYVGLSKFKRHRPGENHYISENFIRTMYCIQDFGLLFAPAISAGLLTSAVKELKVTLYDRLLQERNEEHATTIEVFISYVEARSLNLTVFKIIRLDWSLPLLIVNLCITYQIVVVQLTHLY